MENLEVINLPRAKLEEQVLNFCLDTDNSCIYYISASYEIFKLCIENWCQRPKEFGEKPRLISTLDCASDDLIAFEYVVERNSLIVALESGRLLRIPVDPRNGPPESLLEHSCRLVSVKISPDQSLIAIADVDNRLILQDVYGTHSLVENARDKVDSIHKPVGVGWGSKETQFFGLDGRPTKEQQLQEVEIGVSQEEQEETDRVAASSEMIKFRSQTIKHTVIDWREDSQFLVTLTLFPESSKHQLKVWNRKLELHHMSEQLVALEQGILAWTHSPQQHICCAQRRSDTLNEVIIFEKNGLVRKRFALPRMLRNLYINQLAWSPDSKVLAIVAKQFSTSKPSPRTLLFLYTLQNSHFYLKFCTYFTDNCEHTLRWDTSHKLKLHVISLNGYYQCYYLIWTYSEMSPHSTVVSVDGSQLKLTPFGLCNIPPPMAGLTIDMDQPIMRIGTDPAEEYLMVLTLDGSLTIFSQDFHDEALQYVRILVDNEPASVIKKSLDRCTRIKIDEPAKYQNLLFTPYSSLKALQVKETGSRLVELKSQGAGLARCELLAEFPGRHVTHIRRRFGDYITLALTFEVGDGILYDEGFPRGYNAITSDYPAIGYLQPEGMTQHIYQRQEFRIECDTMDIQLISLDQDQNLRWNTILVSNSCTSFRLTRRHLIFTRTDQNLHIVSLDNLCDMFDKMEECECLDLKTYSQSIDIGATIVTVDHDTKVVLKLPRGNLEILHPRVLVLERVIEHLKAGEMTLAVFKARRHRVNLNLIYDYLSRSHDSYDSFVTSLGKLATSLGENKSEMLELFVSELDDVDTITSRYQTNLRYISHRYTPKEEPLKINSKHETMLEALNRSKSNLLHPRILCLIKMRNGPPRALEMIYELNQELERTRALKFMLYFVNKDKLFNEALRTRRTEIALMVAINSEQDPKDYLSLLGKFNQIESSNMRAYEMAMHIGDYEGGLQDIFHEYQKLTLSDNHSVESKLITLIDTRRLYKQALKMFSSAGDRVHTDAIGSVWSNYGAYLLEKRHYPEAGLAYSKALELKPSREICDKAFRCYSLSNDWAKSLALFGKAKLYGIDVGWDEVDRIAESLVDRGMCLEAMNALSDTFIESHTIESPLIRKLLSQDNYWLVFWILKAVHDPEELRSDILKSATNTLTALGIELERLYNRFSGYFSRLKQLLLTQRQRKLMYAQTYPDDTLSTIDGSEYSSVTGKTAKSNQTGSHAFSLKTRKTNASTTSRTSNPKRVNLKPNSRHEDIALVLEMKKFVSMQKVHQATASAAREATIEFGDYTYIDRFQSCLDHIKKNFELATEILSTLWPTDEADAQFSLYRVFGNSTVSELDEIDLDMLTRPQLHKDLNLFDI